MTTRFEPASFFQKGVGTICRFQENPQFQVVFIQFFLSLILFLIYVKSATDTVSESKSV